MNAHASTSSRPRVRRGLAALLLLPLLLVLAGCFRLDMGLTIHENETVDVSMEVGDLTGMLGPNDMPCEDLESEITDADEVDFAVETIDMDGNHGCRISADGAPLDSMADGGGMTIEKVDDTFVFTFDGDETGAGDMGQFEDMPGMEPEVGISVTFPGEVIEADGEIDGNTVTWTGLAAFTTGGTATGSAESSGLGGDSQTLVWIILGVVALLAIAALIFFVVKKKNQGGTGAGDAAAPYGGPGGYAQPGQVPADPGHGFPAQPGQPGHPGGGYGAQDQVPADPGPGYPGQEPPAPPTPFSTAAADAPVDRPEGSPFAPPAASEGTGTQPPAAPSPDAPAAGSPEGPQGDQPR